MGNKIQLWPTRKEIPKDLEIAVTPNPNATRKFVRFGMQQSQLRSSLQKGVRLQFTGQAQGSITVETIEDPDGREVGLDKVYRFTGKTNRGMPIIAHAWFTPADVEMEAQRTVVYFNPTQISHAPSSSPIEKQRVEAKIRFADKPDLIRNVLNTGDVLHLRVQSSSGTWIEKEVSILTRSENSETITFKVMGNNKLATVLFNKKDPLESKIVFD